MITSKAYEIESGYGIGSAAEAGNFRHRGPVTGVAAIPNTNAVVTSGYDGAVGFFELDTQRSRLLGYHNHLVNRIVVNQDGTKAGSCSSDYSIRIWDLRTLKPEQVLLGHSDDVEDFLFVDDHIGVSASRDHRIIIWDLQTGAIISIIDGHDRDVLTVAYHEGKVYSAGDDKTLRVWDLSTGGLINMWGPFEQETDTCAINPLQDRVVLGCDDGFIRVFDIQSGGLIEEIKAHGSGIKKVAVSPVSGDLLSAAYDQRILIWDAGTLKPIISLENCPSMWERSLNWSSDGTRILAGTFDGTVLVWDAQSGKRLLEIGNQDEQNGNACFNDVAASDAGEVALVSDDGYIRLSRVNPAAARWTAKVETLSGRMLMNSVTLDDHFGLLVSGAHNHKLHIYKKVDDRLQSEVEVLLGEGPINTIRIAHHPGFEGQSFVGCYSGAIMRVAPDGQIKSKMRVHEGAVKSLRLHPQKPLGVSCGADGLLLGWNFDGEIIERFLGHTAIINDVDMDPSGERIASVSRDFTVKVYELSNGRLLQSIHIGHHSLKSVCYLNDTTIIIGDYWGSLIKVDLDRASVSRAAIASNGISALARSGSHVLAVSYDGGVYLVRPDDLTVVQTLRAMDQRLQQAAL